MRVFVNLKSSIIFVTIQEVQEKDVMLKIRNELKGIDLKVYENSINAEQGIVVRQGETVPFAWTYPRNKNVKVNFVIDSSFQYHPSDCFYSFDDIQEAKRTEIPTSKDHPLSIMSTVVVEGKVRILKFHEDRHGKSQAITSLLKKFDTEYQKVVLDVSIKGIGISLISSLKRKNQTRKYEVINLVLRGLEYKYFQSNLNKNQDMKIKYINIDNNAVLDSCFPVFLTPTNPKILAPETKNHFLECRVYQKISSTKVKFNNFS